MAYFNERNDSRKNSGRRSGKSVLEALNNKLEEQYNSVMAEDDDVDYEALRKSGEPFKGVFIVGEQNGDYSYFDGKYKVVMTKSEMEKFGLFDKQNEKFNLLGEELNLKVVSVSDEPNMYGKIVVSVTFSNAPSLSYERDVRRNVVREIDRQLRKGETLVVWGVVTAVREQQLLVSICDAGVLGIMPVMQWQPSYTRSMTGLAKVGDALKFAVLKPMPDRKGKEKAYMLSRRHVAEDFWGESALYGLKEGELIVVTCTEVPRDKSYWWGTSERIPGLELMGEYTENFLRENTVFPNIQYMCKVKRIEKVNYKGVDSFRVQVRPLEVCKHCRVAHANMRRMKGIKGKTNV